MNDANKKNGLSDVNLIVMSVDIVSMLIAAAILALGKAKRCNFVFVRGRSFDGNILMERLKERARVVAFIGFGPGEDGESWLQQLVQCFREEGHRHEIVAVFDASSRVSIWRQALGSVYDHLQIRPRDASEGVPGPAQMLWTAVAESLDKSAYSHARDLAALALSLERGKQEGSDIPSIILEAAPGGIEHDGRREYMIRIFSNRAIPDRTIDDWRREFVGVHGASVG